jgi:hypothetical protein
MHGTALPGGTKKFGLIGYVMGPGSPNGLKQA